MLALLLLPLLLPCTLAAGGRPSGDSSCLPTFPARGVGEAPSLEVLVLQGGHPAWRAPALHTTLALSQAATTNLTRREMGGLCEALAAATTGTWCQDTLNQLTEAPRVLGMGYTNSSEVCA